MSKGAALAWVGVAAWLSGCAADAAPRDTFDGTPPVTLHGLQPWAVLVHGEVATGMVALPAASSGTLVVVAHGLGSRAADAGPMLQRLASSGAYGLAMDFRGPALGWNAEAGADDTVAATLAFQRAHPDIRRTVLYGYSMGGEVSGLALARAPAGTFTVWIAGSGVADLADTWQEVPAFRPLIESAVGGTPGTVPGVYRDLSPANQGAAIAQSRVSRIYLVHGLGDPVVPVRHSERMYRALDAAGVSASFLMVTADRDTMACIPLAAVCPIFAPVGPAGHEAGWSRVTQRLLDHEVAGSPDTPTGRLLVDAVTGTQTPLPG